MNSKPPFPRLSTSLRLKHLEKERLQKLSKASIETQPSEAPIETQSSKAPIESQPSKSDKVSDSKPPYPRLSTSIRLKHLEKDRLRKLSKAPSETDTEMQPSKADEAMVTSESDSDDELFGYDPNFEIKASAKRQRVAPSSKQSSESSDSEDEVLDFDPNFATSAKKTFSPKTQLETSTTAATSTVTESFDSKQPSTTDTETQQHSENDDEFDENESSSDENESSSDENDSSDDENEEGSPITQINPPAMEMFAEVLVDILLDFIDDHNAKLGIISSEFPKERLRSILMGTEKSFEDMPSMFEIILLVLHLVSSVCGDMEDGGLDMDAFVSNEGFQNDFLDDVFAFLEPFSGLFSNKRLNNHHDMKTHRFAASTLLEFLYGRIDLTEDEIKLYCALVLSGFFDGDGSVNFDANRSSPWRDGVLTSPFVNIRNYHQQGENATKEEIERYYNENPTRIHSGHAPRMQWDMCSVYGLRSSPFAIAIMDFLNTVWGEPEGGVTKFLASDKRLHLKGFVKDGNSFYITACSTEGQGSQLELSKVGLIGYLLKTVIIKYAEIENILGFTECVWHPGNTLSRIRREVPEKSPAATLAIEGKRRQMTIRDKQLKLDRKEICSNGLADEPVQMYKERLGKLNQSEHLEVIKSLPRGSIHTNNLLLYLAGLGMAEGCIDPKLVTIAQVNHSFNAALSQAVTPYIGRLGVNGQCTRTTSRLQTVIFLLAVGMHYSHRKEQVIIALFYYLFRHHSAAGVKVDLQFIKEKITEKWQSMSDDKKSELSATFKKWMEDEGRNREYDGSNGFVNDDEIESTLKVLEKVLKKLLYAYKAKDPS